MEAQDIISSGLLEVYAVGASSVEESRDVEGWVKQYPEVATELSYIQDGIEAYAETHAIAPGVSVKEKVFIRINASMVAPVVAMKERETAKVYSISPTWKYAAAASIILLIGSLILNYTYYNKYKSVDNDLQIAQTELKQQKLAGLAMLDDINKIGNKNAMHVSLKGMPALPEAAARIYWMQDTHEVYIDPSNLPEPPQGMQYQLWGIVDGKPVSGGMITLIKDGKKINMLPMKSFGRAEAFAISIEKAGPEKAAPSPDVVVMGKI